MTDDLILECNIARAEADHRTCQLARVRSRLIATSFVLASMVSLLEHNKEGFCELAAENIQLMNENAELKELLEKARK